MVYYQYYYFKVNHHEHLKYECSLFKVTRRKPKNTLLEAFILNFEQIQYAAFILLMSDSIKPLIHGQINLIKFIESNKFDINVYCKI